jgi:Ca2+-binding RTX toxin-like protein
MSKRLAAFLAGTIMAGAAAVVIPTSPAQATALPALTSPLTDAATKLVESSLLPDLNQLVPGLATNPAQLFDLHSAFTKLAALPDNADLETAIDGLDGGGFTFGNVHADDGTKDTLTFDLAIDRDVPIELGIIDGEVQLLGGSVDVHVHMEPTTITAEFDPAVGGGDEFALTNLPRFDIDLTMDETLNESLQFGFAQADATGDFDVNSRISLQLTDPDASGRLTLAELTTADIADVMAASFDHENAPTNELSASITLTADVAGTDFTGTVTIADEKLFEGTEPAIDISLDGANPISLLTNVGPDSALAGLNQILSTFGAGMIAGDRPLPFLDGGLFIPAGLDNNDFDQVFDAVKPLYDYVQSRSVQLNCGAFPFVENGPVPTPSDNVPLLPTKGLVKDQYVACRAFAGDEPRAGEAVTWNPTGATRLTSVPDSFTSVAVEPTTSVIFKMSAPGNFGTTLTFTPDDTGVEMTVQQRAQTIQQLITELQAAGALPANSVTWDANLEALVFKLSFQSASFARSAGVDAGNGLAADTHLTGLSGKGNVAFEVGPISADLSVGMILTEDAADIGPEPDSPGASTESRRFFVKVPDSGNLVSVDDVDLTGSAGFEGRLGFLEVNGSAGLTASRPDSNAPALAVQLKKDPNHAGVEIEGVGSDANAILIPELLAKPVSYLDVATNFAVHGDVDLTADALVANAGASFKFDWPLDGAPTTSDFAGNFDSLVDFDASETLTVTESSTAATDEAVAPGKPVEVSVTTSATDLNTKPGLVGAVLTRDGQPDCQITSVPSNSTLSCTLTVPESGLDDPPLATGDYEVVGNTLSHLVKILDTIASFADKLQQAVDTAQLGDDVEIWGVKPSDIAAQARKLKLLVDEMRGLADAVVTCEPGSDELELRGLPVGQGAITCHAGNGNTAASNVRWRVVDTETGAGAWSDDPAGTTVGSDPKPTQTLTVPDSVDRNNDGFLAMGTEWTAVVEWTDAQGEHRASLPPPTPGSLTRLEQLVQNTLGLPDDALELGLDTAGQTPTLTIKLDYGICSSTAPADLTAECAGKPTGPTPSTKIAFNLGDHSLASLSVTGDPVVTYAALGQFNLGVPLNGDTPEILDGTELKLTARVDAPNLGLEANLGPFAVQAGAKVAGIAGTALAGSADGVLVVSPALADQIPDGARIDRTSDHDTCVVSAHGAADADGNIPLTCTGVAWAEDDAFTVLIGGELKGQLGLTVTIPAGAIGSQTPTVKITGLTNDCGPLPGGTPVGGSLPTGAPFACARLGLGLKSGNATKYLGEVGVDVVDTDADDFGFSPAFAVVVPADLASKLADAILDPAFLLQALPPLLRDIATQLRNLAESGIPDAVGDPLRSAAEGLEGIADTVAEVLDLGNPSNAGGIEDALENALGQLLGDFLAQNLAPSITVETKCGPNNDPCDPGASPAAIDDISVHLDFSDTIEATTPVNLGLEGLPLSVQGGVTAGAKWELSTAVGLSRTDGPYISAPTASLTAFVEFADNSEAKCSEILPKNQSKSAWAVDPDDDGPELARCLKARLGFLDVEAIDAKADDERTTIKGEATLGLTGGGDNVITFNELTQGDVAVDADIGGTLRVNLALRTGIAGTGTDLPSILGTLHFEAAASAGGGFEQPDFDFGNLYLDVGTYLANFLQPVIDGINDIISPFKPIIDVINAPIPVVSDLAALVGEPPVTMISLLEAATGADLSMVKAILKIVQFVGEIAEVVSQLPENDPSFQLPLGELVGLNALAADPFEDRAPGSFSVDTSKASQATTPENRGSYIGNIPQGGAGGGFVNDIAGKSGMDEQGTDAGRPTTFGVPGLSFPFLDDASQIFGLLVGKDATLIRWEAGTMEASAGLSWDFGPIMVGPVPITISIGGEIGLRGRFAIGYDTVGIRKLIDGGNAASLLDGIFIDDLDAQGNDVNELEFFGRVWAGASVDLVIISAGVKGGIELTFGLNLNDSPDPDGKLRIDEILDKLQNPICLFDVNGRIEAFLAVFVKIDLFFFTEEYSFELVRITLLEWSSACEPPEPDLAEKDGNNVLHLNVGSRFDKRNVGEDEADEKLEVRQLNSNGDVRVSGYGYEETAENVDLIVFDAGTGDDEILFLPGGEEGNTIPFTVPVAGSGGPGSDIVKIGGEASDNGAPTGGAPDLIRGDASLAGVTSWAGVTFTPVAGMNGPAGNDAVEPGAGDDTVAGNGGEDTLTTGLGNDSLDGGAENDRLTGGPGNDVLSGGGADDTLSGGPSELTSPNDDDVIRGGVGTDTITGDVGNDVLFGDDSPDGVITGDPTLVFSGNKADWASWCDDDGQTDLMTGNDGDDILIGNGGDDQIIGNAGDDKAKGCEGADLIAGDADEDELHGDAGTDTINGGPQNDVIRGGTENDVTHGDEGNDIVFGDEHADFVHGDDGLDILVGDTGSVNNPSFGVANVLGTAPDADKAVAMDASVDHSHGGTGARRASCDPLVPATGNSDCIFGGNGSDAAFGTGDGDIIEGNAGVDLLVGDTGDDLIRGGTDIDVVFGRDDDDVLFGESSADLVFGDRPVADWPTDTPSVSGGADQLFGGPGTDRLEGDGGTDAIFGGADNDHAEGNSSDDTILGESGNDDLIGGSDMAGVEDDGETAKQIDGVDFTGISGGEGQDVIAGDNASITAGGYVLGRAVTLLDPTIGGDDTIEGDAGKDAAFGEFGDDTMWGDHGIVGPLLGAAAPDYLEGDDGDDEIHGEQDTDDIVGGNSAQDGVIDTDRVGTGLPDGGETLLDGGPARDWIAGDNARMDRVLGNGFDYDSQNVTPIKLFDLATVATSAAAGSFGDDTVTGGDDTDLIFGQGGADNLSGDGGADYVEGNNENDTIAGGEANDDLIGGGSANDGVIDGDRVGNTLLDLGETDVTGGPGIDWITGDNALVKRNVDVVNGPPRAPIELFDVQIAGGPAIDTGTSGGDLLQGNEANDRIFGQGNGVQPATQIDPDDDRNNDFVGTLQGSADFNRSTGTADEDDNPQVKWLGDVILGGIGDDEIEGNHGNDLMFGNGRPGTPDNEHDEDDIAGGGSANPTAPAGNPGASSSKIFDNAREGLGAALLDGFDTIHGDSANNTVGDDDAVVGDNGWVQRLATKQAGPGPEKDANGNPIAIDQFDRNVQMTTTKAVDGTFANDFISGNGGHDELYGQQGDDYVEGGFGSDAMVGDLGKVTTDLFTDNTGNAACGAARTISPNEPFVQEPVCQPGTLFRLVQLHAFNDNATAGQTPVAAGNDVMLGLDGDDWMHGGPGTDMMNGDGDAGAESDHPSLPGVTVVADPNGASADNDHIFGGDSNGSGGLPNADKGGNGDAVWGGRGHDHTYGGRGDDMLEVRPDPNNAVNFPPEWSAWAEADVESFHDVDFVYGGYDQDAMQANIADNGPNFGDRLFDWVGAYNIYYLCPATYGAYVNIRDQSPAILAYFEDQARTDGALTPATSGTSGFNELALVYKPDVKNNSNPIYPGTPGHFFCPA